MSEFYMNNPAFGVVGDLRQQFSCAEVVKKILQQLFGKVVYKLDFAEGPFYFWDQDAQDVEVVLDETPITISGRQQGLIALFRYGSTRGLTKLTAPIAEQARLLFGDELYTHFFVKIDWQNFNIYQYLRQAR